MVSAVEEQVGEENILSNLKEGENTLCEFYEGVNLAHRLKLYLKTLMMMTEKVKI